MRNVLPAVLTLALTMLFCSSVVHAQASATPTWTQLLPVGQPPSLTGEELFPVYDPSSNEIITFGGLASGSPCCTNSNGVWILSNANGEGGVPQWTALAPATPQGIPAPRARNSAIYDTATNRMVIFGGGQNNGNAFGTLFNDTWVLTNANGQGGTPTWIPLNPIGGPPAARTNHRALYDSANNRMIVFGGGNNGIMSVPNDVWVLTNANGLGGVPQWIQLSPAGQAPPNEGFAAGYDAVNNVLIVTLGCCYYTNTSYTLTNANGLGGTPQWTQLSPSGVLPAIRDNNTYGYNTSLNRLLIFGADAQQYNDLWYLNAANGLDAPPSWSNPIPNGVLGSPPALNSMIGGVYDQISDRLMVLRSGPDVPTGQGLQLWDLSNATGQGASRSNWTHTWGGPANDTGNSVARDSSGNIYVAGSTSSFGAGGQDVLLLKYDSNGNLLWTRTWGGASDDFGAGVAVDAAGSVYVTGGTQSFGAGSDDVFLLKFDGTGNLLWSNTWGGGSYDVGHDIAFDTTGNVYIGAETYSYNPPNTGSSSAAILKFSPDGSLLWSRIWASGVPVVTGPVYEGGYSLDIDNSGNIFLSGITWDYNDSPNHNSIFVVKWDSSGNFLWNRNWAGPSEDEAWGTKTVRADPAGNVYVAGRTASQCTSSNFATCDFDVLLLKLDSNGNFLWSKTWKPDTGYDTAISLAFDASGNIVITGQKDEFGPAAAALLLRYDPSGNLLSSLIWNGGVGSGGSAVLVDPAGNLLVAGAAPNNAGSWQNATGVTGTENGTLSTQASSVESPVVTLGLPLGTITSPTGVTDTGGGGQDAFLSMITPGTLTSGFGSASVSLSTTLLNFPNQMVNTTSSAMAVTVTNTGNATLNITATPPITGTNGGDFTLAVGTTCTSGASVAHGNSCEIDIVFTPHTASPESATLSIFDNASNSPQIVSMGGGGVVVVPPPLIESLQPSILTRNTTVPGFTISGTGFQPNSMLFLGNDISVSGLALNSQGQLTGTLNISPTATLGCHDVTVTSQPGGQSSTLSCGVFVVNSVSPAPGFLQVVVGNNEVLLRWASVVTYPPITSYLISVEVFDTQTISFKAYGSTFVGPDQTSALLSALDGGKALQNGVIYRFTVAGVSSVGVNGESTQPVAGMPSSFQVSAITPPQHPILFVHGITSQSAVGYWKTATDFVSQSLNWKNGGMLNAASGGSTPTVSGTIAPSPGDFYTVLFSNSLANAGGIERQGAEVGAFVSYLSTRFNGFPKVSLFAHSMGGLASRAYLQSSVNAGSKVSELITYGTPHLGVLADDLQNQYNEMLNASGPRAYLAALFILPQLNKHGITSSIFNSVGFAEMNSSCTPSGSQFQPSQFLSALNTLTGGYAQLPTNVSYKFLAGQYHPPSLFGVLNDNQGEFFGGRNIPCSMFEDNPSTNQVISTDAIVPLKSADPSLALPTAFPSGIATQLFQLHTAKAHWEETEDIPTILCALSANCMVAEAHSPIDLLVIQPDGTQISPNLTQVPGAGYETVQDSAQHDTAIVTIPFPMPGLYTIKAIPKAGALPTDTYSISIIQNGNTQWLAQNAQVAAIPSSGYQIHPNSAPVATIRGPSIVEATGRNGASVTLVGSAVDPDGDPVLFRWMGSFGDVAGSVLTTTLPLGNNRVVLVATDSHGATGTREFTVGVRDTMRPVITCGTPDALWHVSDVNIRCTAGDAGSGLANSQDASFSLNTSVPAGTETSNAPTGTRSICDVAGNCTTAGPIAGNMVDKKPPAINIAAPINGAAYAANQKVKAAYGCTDLGSGVTTCAGTVPSGTNIDTSPNGPSTTKTFAVKATDAVNNTFSQSLSYTVSCHYVALATSPSVVSRGGRITITDNVQSCTPGAQKISEKFTFSGPLGPSCSKTSTVMFTTPQFTLPAGTSKTISFPFIVPKNACAGTYAATSTTLLGAVIIDSTSATLTVQ